MIARRRERRWKERKGIPISLVACLPAVESQYCVVIIINMCYYPPIHVNNKATKGGKQAITKTIESEAKKYFFLLLLRSKYEMNVSTWHASLTHYIIVLEYISKSEE